MASGVVSPRAPLPVRGVVYDTGVDYTVSALSRDFWHASAVAGDMRSIARDLHCTAVSIIGSEHQRLREAAELALAEGLDVWLQPRRIEATGEASLEHLAVAADIAEDLRRRGDREVVLTLGCELSLFLKGILPGRSFLWRMRSLYVAWMAMPFFDRRLNPYLDAACRTAREHFGGPLTYSAGEWEGVDWTPFDFVGVDLYRDGSNAGSYRDKLRGLAAHGKPVVITEFGCAAFTGAERKGGGAFLAIDWRQSPPVLKPGHVRDEAVQARYLGELISLYKQEAVEGAFVYAFSEPRNVHTDDPRTDLDMAGYGVVKVVQPATAEAPERWLPKLAFGVVSDAYARP